MCCSVLAYTVEKQYFTPFKQHGWQGVRVTTERLKQESNVWKGRVFELISLADI